MENIKFYAIIGNNKIWDTGTNKDMLLSNFNPMTKPEVICAYGVTEITKELFLKVSKSCYGMEVSLDRKANEIILANF